MVDGIKKRFGRASRQAGVRGETNSCLNGNDKEVECLSAKMVIYVRKRYLDDSFYTLRF